MLFSENNFSLLYFVLLWINAELIQRTVAASSPDIHADYYFGSAELRTRDKVTCDDDILKVICYDKCGGPYKCKNNRCECVDKEDKKRKKGISRTSDGPEPYYHPFEDHKYLIHSKEFAEDVSRTGVFQNRERNEDQPNDEIYERPALRHHIAHFCPNLEEARKCIRGCMKLGKPAFCGKDHVCYCGHKYSSHDENEAMNQSDMYAEFRDLYEKYFGPQNNEKAHSEDD